MIMMINMIDKIKQAFELLNEVDTYIDSLNLLLSNQDSKISDLEHLIENENMNAYQACRVIKEIHNVTNERRKIKNDMAIANTYHNHKNKMIQSDNRNLMIIELHKTESKLNQKYKNRIYTEDEIQKMMKKLPI